MNSFVLSSKTFIFILPVALSWLAIDKSSFRVVLISFCAMAAAEILRQYLSQNEDQNSEPPKQLFFFGVIYKDTHGSFLNRTQKVSEKPKAHKYLRLAGIYLLSMAVRLNPQFAALDFTNVALFSLVIALWVNCSSYRALSRLLFLQMLITAAIFLPSPESSTIGFLVWLMLSLLIQMHVQSWRLAEQSKSSLPVALSNWGSAPRLLKSLMLVAVSFCCFRVADFLIPIYSHDEQVISDAKLPPALIHQMAKLKLQAGSGKSALSFGDNQKSLESLKQEFLNDKNINPSNFEKMRSLAKKIHVGSAGPEQDFDLEDRIKKMQSLQGQHDKVLPDLKTHSDEMVDYLHSRQELSSEIDKLISQDQKNTLAKEEINIQEYFDKLIKGLKKFSLLLALAVILIYWLSRKRNPAVKSAGAANRISLPKEIKIRLKTLYKLLLSEKLSGKEEVLKSFYILELAFKEIEFPREIDLPPFNFQQKINSELPFVSGCTKIPIELFNRVFYGDKNPDSSQMIELRASMKELMKKLQVL